MKSNIDRIRKIRSINDARVILSSINKEVTVFSSIVRKKKSTSAEEGIRIGRSGGKAPVTAPNKLEKFEPPNHQHVIKFDNIINALYERSLDLDALVTLLKHTFEGLKHQPAAVKACQDLQEEVNTLINEAFNGLAEVSFKHIPNPVKGLILKLREYLAHALDKKSYEGPPKEATYVTPVYSEKDSSRVDGWQFTTYLSFTHLHNEQGYVFDEYNVVLTAVVNSDHTIEYFINAVPDFRIPSKSIKGKKFGSPGEMVKFLGIMIRHKDLIHILDKKSIPLDSNDVKGARFHKIPNVIGANIVDDNLVILVDPEITNDEVKEVAKEALLLFKSILGEGAKHYTITWKYRKNKNAIYMALGQAIAKNLKQFADVNKLNEIKEAFELNEEEYNHLKRLLKTR